MTGAVVWVWLLCSCFCADVLAHLSYGTLEEPLWVVHNLNRLISVRGATLAAQLKALLQLPPDTDQHTPIARERRDPEPASPAAAAAAAPTTTEPASPALRTPTRAKGAGGGFLSHHLPSVLFFIASRVDGAMNSRSLETRNSKPGCGDGLSSQGI